MTRTKLPINTLLHVAPGELIGSMVDSEPGDTVFESRCGRYISFVHTYICTDPNCSNSWDIENGNVQLIRASKKHIKYLIIKNLKQIIKKLPRTIKNLPLIIENLPRIIKNLPQRIKNLPRIIKTFRGESIFNSPRKVFNSPWKIYLLTYEGDGQP